MATLEDQLAWEQECLDRGSKTYYNNQERLRENGQGDTTDVAKYLLHTRLEETGVYLKQLVDQKGVGVYGQYHRYISMVAGKNDDYLKVAYMGLKHVVTTILEQKRKTTLLRIVMGIGIRLETEVKCVLFENSHPEYFDTVRKSFAQQRVTDFTHKQKVMMKKFNDFDLIWNSWTKHQQVKVGSVLVQAIVAAFDDVFWIENTYSRGKTTKKLSTTEEFDKWAIAFEKEKGLLNPNYLPLKIKPKEWQNQTTGAYYTPRMQMKFIKTKGKDHKRYIKPYIPEMHIKAVNKMQNTAWQINKRVLDVQIEIYQHDLEVGMPSKEIVRPQPFPADIQDVPKELWTEEQVQRVKDWKMTAKIAHGKEQQRKGRVLAFMQGHRLARELRDWPELYFAYTCDFRGRIYCATSGLSPQGADASKGLLQFAEAVTLGKQGIEWLAVQGANTFGVDKVSYADRRRWVRDHEDAIRATCADPVNTREFWGEADKPYQFLAFCFEWHDCDYGINTNTKGKIPVGLDGSCNGLQHFSAMLRDEVGAKATNLLPCEKPEDIYAEVANVTTTRLLSETDPMARTWLRVGVNRKCAKRPVMTLPYGATMQSARTYVMEYTMENWASFRLDEDQQWVHAKYLTPILWGSIGDVVIAARQGMAWLQRQAKDDYLRWLTPIGFPVYQFYKSVPAVDVITMIDGKIRLKIQDFDNDGIAKRSGQRNGIAPNFVHSIDSTHMVMTILGTELTSYAMIHDDFGTHAGNTQHLFDEIRKAFLKLYTEFDVLKHWGEQVGANMKTLPEYGSYDIQDILKAEYFFG